MPKVSVIVPNYNHAPFLTKRLESIFNQTYRNFEVILLDDFSTDTSRNILRKYKDHKKVSYTDFNQKNSGSPFKQWQKGIEKAQGEYIWIAESDDWADEKLLETFIPKLEEGVDLVYCRSVKVNELGEKINDEFWPDSLHPTRWRSDFKNNGRNEIRNYLAYKTTIPNASSCVFRKKEGMFTNDILESRFTGDWIFWINYLEKANLAFIGKPLNYHRFHTGATRSQKDINSRLIRLEERLKAINLARSICKKGRISVSEYRKYKYLIGFLSKIKKEVGLKTLLRIAPFELIFYTYLFDLNRVRHSFMGNLSRA